LTIRVGWKEPSREKQQELEIKNCTDCIAVTYREIGLSLDNQQQVSKYGIT
jgi:hypothetical protein